MRLWINEIKLPNVHTFKRPVLHPPTLELPFSQIEMEEVHAVLCLETMLVSIDTHDDPANDVRQ